MSDFHGRFIWYELMTPDTGGAKSFYGKVVGWTSQEMSGSGMEYTVLQADGNGVGGMMGMPEEARSRGIPPNWTGYIGVDDVDAATDKVKRLGGSVMRPPEDIPGIGRFSVVADPAGAVFAMMTPAPLDQPRPEIPAGAPGNASWHELYGAKPEEGFGFYGDMFGWSKDDAMDMGPMGTYQLFHTPFGQGGGMMRRPDNIPAPCWLYYFQVGDIGEAASRVKSAGGQVLNGPMEVPGGDWIIQGQDPQGAMFAVVGKKAA